MPFSWVGTISARNLIMRASLLHGARPFQKKFGSTWLRNEPLAFSRRIARTCMFRWADAMRHGPRNVASPSERSKPYGRKKKSTNIRLAQDTILWNVLPALGMWLVAQLQLWYGDLFCQWINVCVGAYRRYAIGYFQTFADPRCV